MVEQDLGISLALRVIAQRGDTAAAQCLINQYIHGVAAGQVETLQIHCLRP